MIGRLQLRARTELGRGGAGVPVAGGLAVGGGQPRGLAGLGQTAVQFARGPAVDAQLTAGPWSQQPRGPALGHVRRAGGQHAGRDRRAEHRGSDEQVLGVGAQPVEQLAEQLLARRQRDHLGGRLGQLGGFGAGGGQPILAWTAAVTRPARSSKWRPVARSEVQVFPWPAGDRRSAARPAHARARRAGGARAGTARGSAAPERLSGPRWRNTNRSCCSRWCGWGI